MYDPKFFIKVPIKPTSSSKWNKFEVIIPKGMPLQKITPTEKFFYKISISKNGIFGSTYIKNLALLSKLWLKLYQLYD